MRAPAEEGVKPRRAGPRIPKVLGRHVRESEGQPSQMALTLLRGSEFRANPPQGTQAALWQFRDYLPLVTEICSPRVHKIATFSKRQR